MRTLAGVDSHMTMKLSTVLKCSTANVALLDERVAVKPNVGMYF